MQISKVVPMKASMVREPGLRVSLSFDIEATLERHQDEGFGRG